MTAAWRPKALSGEGLEDLPKKFMKMAFFHKFSTHYYIDSLKKKSLFLQPKMCQNERFPPAFEKNATDLADLPESLLCHTVQGQERIAIPCNPMAYPRTFTSVNR